MNANHWPSLNLNKCAIPNGIQQAIDIFTVFYNQNFPKRLLQWCFQGSIAEVETNLFDKSYTLIVNTFQAVVLLSFNSFRYNNVTISQIQSACNMKEEEVKAAVVTLSSPSVRVILKISENTYSLNSKFNFMSKRLKVVSLPKNEDIIRKEKIEDDRSYAVEATIVRVMKTNQRIHHNDLVNKVLQQLDQFQVKISVSWTILTIRWLRRNLTT